MTRSARWLPILTLAILPVIWGYSWVPSKLGIGESSAFVYAAFRSFPAAVILLALLPLTGRSLRPKAVGLTAVVGVLQGGGFVGLTSAALVSGGAGHTAMLGNTWQFWLLLLAWFFLGERLRGGQWLSVGLGLVGLVLIIEPWELRGVLDSLLTLGGAVCFAGGAVVAKVLRKRHQVDLLSFTGWQSFFGSIPLVIVALLIPGESITWSGTFIWSLAYSILLGTAAGAILWLYLLNALPANLAGIGTIGTPVVGVLSSWLQLGERLSVSEIVGMVFVVSALSLLALWEATSRRRDSGMEDIRSG